MKVDSLGDEVKVCGPYDVIYYFSFNLKKTEHLYKDRFMWGAKVNLKQWYA